MKKRILLILLLLGILFPFASMARFPGGFATAFNLVFNSLTSHILMHSALFAALSWLVMSFCSKQPIAKVTLFSLGSVLLVALVQEVIQLICAHAWLIKDSLFDIGVDLFAGSLPVIILAINKRKRLKDSQS
jgi:hypothetical protein